MSGCPTDVAMRDVVTAINANFNGRLVVYKSVNDAKACQRSILENSALVDSRLVFGRMALS